MTTLQAALAPVLMAPRIATGITGLDEILCGGLTKNRVYLVEGTPGTGKTTVALQFLLEGLRQGESGLYITLSETRDELRAVAASHGWSLDGLTIFELSAETSHASMQSIFNSAEIELGETINDVMRCVEDVKPMRLAFDSLSELRLLAQNSLLYRRQILVLKQFFSSQNCTVLLLDDKSSGASDQQLHSISHGVISLEQVAQEFGRERRRVNVIKMRGIKYRGGYHDYALDTGGVTVFPRLSASGTVESVDRGVLSSGAPMLDHLLGGGLTPGTNTLMLGPSGIGKTTLLVRCLVTALQRGEKASFYLFDEGLGTLYTRSAALGMDLRGFVESGALQIHHIDPAELAPGEFAQMLRNAVELDSVTFVAIDSLNAYLHAMPGEKFLTLQMHELLAFLNQKGVTTVLVLAQHGLIGEVRSDLDLSYLSDTTVLMRFFESNGCLRRALTVIKSRTNHHALTIHELRFGYGQIEIGAALEGFEGILTGVPTYRGSTPMLQGTGGDDD